MRSGRRANYCHQPALVEDSQSQLLRLSESSVDCKLGNEVREWVPAGGRDIRLTEG